MARLKRNPHPEGLAFELQLLGREPSVEDDRPPEPEWFLCRACLLHDGEPLLASDSCGKCTLQHRDIERLIHSMDSLAKSGNGAEYEPMEPAFRISIRPSQDTGVLVPEEWNVTAMLDLSFLRHGPATGSGPAVVMNISGIDIERFADELRSEYATLRG